MARRKYKKKRNHCGRKHAKKYARRNPRWTLASRARRTKAELKKGLGQWVADYKKMRAAGNISGALKIQLNIRKKIIFKQLDPAIVWGRDPEEPTHGRYRNPHPSGLSYGEQVQRAWKQQKKKGDKLGMLYYETFGPGSSGMASWERFKGSAAGESWIEQQKQLNPRRLSVPERHQLRIARKTLTYSDVGARIMGGPTKAEAREIIKRLTGKTAREDNPPFKTTVVHEGYAAGKRLKVLKHPFKDGVQYSAQAIGRGWRVGTLSSARFTPASLKEYLIREIKASHPRAKIHWIK